MIEGAEGLGGGGAAAGGTAAEGGAAAAGETAAEGGAAAAGGTAAAGGGAAATGPVGGATPLQQWGQAPGPSASVLAHFVHCPGGPSNKISVKMVNRRLGGEEGREGGEGRRGWEGGGGTVRGEWGGEGRGGGGRGGGGGGGRGSWEGEGSRPVRLKEEEEAHSDIIDPDPDPAVHSARCTACTARRYNWTAAYASKAGVGAFFASTPHEQVCGGGRGGRAGVRRGSGLSLLQHPISMTCFMSVLVCACVWVFVSGRASGIRLLPRETAATSMLVSESR